MTAPALYPTRTRLTLAHQIARGEVRHYWWSKPVTFWRSDDQLNERKVTAEVALLVGAGLATHGTEDPGNWTVVELTDAGREWLERGAP